MSASLVRSEWNKTTSYVLLPPGRLVSVTRTPLRVSGRDPGRYGRLDSGELFLNRRSMQELCRRFSNRLAL
jgi:hypothetical protein